MIDIEKLKKTLKFYLKCNTRSDTVYKDKKDTSTKITIRRYTKFNFQFVYYESKYDSSVDGKIVLIQSNRKGTLYDVMSLSEEYLLGGFFDLKFYTNGNYWYSTLSTDINTISNEDVIEFFKTGKIKSICSELMG
jgi:hypothetical protein